MLRSAQAWEKQDWMNNEFLTLFCLCPSKTVFLLGSTIKKNVQTQFFFLALSTSLGSNCSHLLLKSLPLTILRVLMLGDRKLKGLQTVTREKCRYRRLFCISCPLKYLCSLHKRTYQNRGIKASCDTNKE